MKETAQNRTRHTNYTMGFREWILIIILSLLWGGSFFFVEVAVETVPPFSLVLVRVGLAALVLWGFVLATGRRIPRDRGIWGGLLVLGLLNNVLPFGLIAWGQTVIESGLAAILNAFSPVFSAILAHFLTRDERLTPNRIAGVVCGWAGVAVLIGVTSLSGDAGAVLAQTAVLAAALLYALAAVFARRFKNLDPVVVAAGMLSGSTLITLPLAFVLERPLALAPTPGAWAALAGLAVVSTALAYIIYFHVLARAGATNLLLVTFLIPVSAIFLGVAVLGESLSWNALAGMALIFAGLAAIDGRLLKRIKKN